MCASSSSRERGADQSKARCQYPGAGDPLKNPGGDHHANTGRETRRDAGHGKRASRPHEDPSPAAAVCDFARRKEGDRQSQADAAQDPRPAAGGRVQRSSRWCDGRDRRGERHEHQERSGARHREHRAVRRTIRHPCLLANLNGRRLPGGRQDESPEQSGRSEGISQGFAALGEMAPSLRSAAGLPPAPRATPPPVLRRRWEASGMRLPGTASARHRRTGWRCRPCRVGRRSAARHPTTRYRR